MKTLYLKFMCKSVLSVLALLGFSSFALQAQNDFPVPSQALLFNNQDSTYQTDVPDSSGNGVDAYWWAYRNGEDQMYAHYAPTGGKFGGAWYISGYHICCEEMASPSMDFILLAGNHNQNKDAEGFKGDNPVYHEGFNSLSLAFWFKSDRNYSEEHTPCPPQPNGMHEQEILVSIGSTNGIAINNFKGYYEVKIGQKAPEGTADSKAITYLYQGEGAVNKEWQHIAITYDGASNGALTVYINGEIAKTYLGDPNPLETGYTELYPDNTSSEIGAQNAGGLFGNVSAFWGADNIGSYCITAADTTYRTGWPANGYYDDYVFYKNVVLTQEQIQCIMNGGIDNAMKGICSSAVKDVKQSPAIRIYPNPSNGTIRLSTDNSNAMDLRVYNVLGKLVLQRSDIRANQEINISSLNKGVYIVKVNNNLVQKLILK